MFILLLHFTPYIFSIFVFQAKKRTSFNDMLTHLRQAWVCFLHGRDSPSFGKDKDTVPGLTAITPSRSCEAKRHSQRCKVKEENFSRARSI